MDRQLKQKHRAAKSLLAYRKAERKKDALAFAEIAYDVFKEKKRKENDKIRMDQNDVQVANN